jgi:hypothetical protein
LVLVAGSCSSPTGPAGHQLPSRDWLGRIGRKADKVIVYEGLPHQGYYPDLVAQELKSKDTIKIDNYAFYREPLELKVDDLNKLHSLLADSATLADWIGEKKCGGFHPDYCVESVTNGESRHALICFGCDEILFSGADFHSRIDIAQAARPTLARILLPYRKSLPDTEQRRFIEKLHLSSNE